MIKHDRDPLPRSFYARDVLAVARDLIGRILVHESPDGLTSGRLVEVEAYRGPADRAAHSYGGRRTRRNEAMYGMAGHAYIFRIHGRIDCFNIVTGEVGEPQAVLVRALEPLEGLELMAARRGLALQGSKSRRLLTAGPGRLAQAMGLTLAMNGLDLCGPELYLTAGIPAVEEEVGETARINVDYAGEWKNLPWRFQLRGSPYVSVRPRAEGKAKR